MSASGGFVARHGHMQYKPYWLRRYSREGLCEICGGPPNGRPMLVFDHCHAHGWVRGLICNYCNEQAGYVDNARKVWTFMTGFLERFPEYWRNCPDCRESGAEPPTGVTFYRQGG